MKFHLPEATYSPGSTNWQISCKILSRCYLNVKLPEEGIVLTKSIESFENHLILQALQVTGNNKNQAAKLLGMNRTTLVERIKKRGLVDLKAPQKEL